MAVEISAQSRKRSRDDSDPLSPSSTVDLKRQRLDAGSPAVGDSRFGAIASAISGVFGYRRQSVGTAEQTAQNGQNGHADARSAYPEPSEPQAAMTSLPSASVAPVPTATSHTIIPAAEPAPHTNTNTAYAPTAESPASASKAGSTGLSAPAAAPPTNRPLGRIEIRLPTMSGPPAGLPCLPGLPGIKLSALKGTKWDPDAGKGAKPGKKKAGRPPKVAISAPAPRGGFNPGIKPISINTEDFADQENDLFNSPSGTPTKARPFAHTPKGILTPTKARGGIRSSKSVKFDRHGEVFFDDLPKSPLFKPKPSPRKRKQEEEEDDTITCAICSKPHSKPPNEIILCENCDFAVHQECYDVPEIPEGDWLCKSCAQYDVAKPKPEMKEEPKAEVRTIDRPDIPNLDKHVRSLQRVLLDKCTGRRRLRMAGQEEAAEKVRQLLEQTVLAGEGNSMLLIGPRGSGKTTMVENTIADLSREHKHAFHTVRLNGFIHTDDKLALKEIWRQLGKEMQVEDDLLHRSNYADTMTSLLALLSHPEEISGTSDGMTSQSVLFVIDEFDMFATHPRQTLLYNLFDIAQSRKAPIAVLGCTTRLDVVETLEKRVKSRFSHRYVYLSPPRNPLAYWQVCKQGLTVTAEDAAGEGLDVELEGFAEFIKYWNFKIEDLYTQRAFQDLLQFHYYTSKSASTFFTEWILALSTLNLKDLRIKVPTASSPITSLSPPDSKMSLLASLSDLDLALLIAAARLDIVAHTDTVNFAMAYDEYASIVGRQRVQSATSGLLAVGGSVRVWSRGVAGMAWERLISLGLLVPSGIGGGARRVGGLEGRMWKVDVALEEIPAAVKLSAVMAKWCREI
ncbi:Putative PHD-finger domain-containing protein [[Torrubiella] hemipterigena]|uniref:Origin recognition complex subunit 4 n=1 Tax=[Torrubiella] hemipterigena TaxID=1531966 RepID=A0A0A1T1N9_9HYPO|nr:Putative PHD-finger domain-containing protein [[Torrubiella] hemipterigena]